MCSDNLPQRAMIAPPPRLAHHGYLPIPIRPGEKRPALPNDWPDARLSDADIALHAQRGCGVGILCGQGEHPIAGVDIDSYDSALVADFVAWCSTHIGVTAERIGQPPKTMLVYRAAAPGWPKTTGRYFIGSDEQRHRLEILGHGQQFVCYGTHPDTGGPYQWIDLFGGLDCLDAASLPVISTEQIAAAHAEFERLALAAGLSRINGAAPAITAPAVAVAVAADDDDPLMHYHPPAGLSLEQAGELLAPLDAQDYDVWLRCGMALHHEFAGADAALDIWNAWSSSTDNYAGRDDLARRWSGFVVKPGRDPIGAAWLLARSAEATQPTTRRALTEFGNAQRLLDRYGEGVRYVAELATWYAWRGNHWRGTQHVHVEHLAKSTIAQLPHEAHAMPSASGREAAYRFCATSQKIAMVRNMVALAQSDPRVVVPVGELDKDPNLLGCANGVVDLRTGEHRDARQADLITQVAHAEYHADATAPVFARTVADCFFDDATMVRFFQRLIGYSLLGSPTEDVLVIPHGNGSNGKSTVLGAIRHALGAHARMASADSFLTHGTSTANAGGAREDVLRLRGARMIHVTESDSGSVLREGLIKSMTGGESLPARGLYAKTTIEVTPTWVAFLPTNHRPVVRGDDYAIWRRLLPVPFTRNFDTDTQVKKDPARGDRLRDEAAGILAWCVRGALDYRARGLEIPELVHRARAEYRGDMDLLADWIAECCELGEDCADSVASLWASWEMFARGRGELRYIHASRGLSRRLAARNFTEVRNSMGITGRGFRGICAKNDVGLD